MQGADGQLHVFFINHDRGLDFAGGNHLNVDALFAQGAEHFAGDAHVAAHANAHDGDFANFGVALHIGRTQRGQDFFFQQVGGAGKVVAVDGEAEVGFAILADVLDDHVHFNVGFCHSAQNLVGDTGLVGYAQHVDFGFVAIERNAGNDGLFHLFVFLKGDQGARFGFFMNVDVPRREAGEHTQRHFVFACKLNRANLQHFAAQRGHFQHFFKADGLQATRFGHHAGVCGVDAIDVGVNQALMGFHGRSHGHRRGV